MSTTVEHQITAVEERLRLAMLASDSRALDELISQDLIFTNHLGQALGKQADLELHRSGVLKFYTLEPSETQVKTSGQLAIISVRMQLTGSYGGVYFSTDLRFTRVWCRSTADAWQIVAGHSSAVQA
jgi:ketosteroid isomerase-like protein